MSPAQCLEQRQHLQPSVGVGHQLRHDLRLPHVGERVLPCAPTTATPSPSTATARSATCGPPPRSSRPPPRPPPASLPAIRFSRNRRTWASVTNPSSARKTGSVTGSAGRPPRRGRSAPRRPAKIIVVDQGRAPGTSPTNLPDPHAAGVWDENQSPTSWGSGTEPEPYIVGVWTNLQNPISGIPEPHFRRNQTPTSWGTEVAAEVVAEDDSSSSLQGFPKSSPLLTVANSYDRDVEILGTRGGSAPSAGLATPSSTTRRPGHAYP